MHNFKEFFSGGRGGGLGDVQETEVRKNKIKYS